MSKNAELKWFFQNYKDDLITIACSRVFEFIFHEAVYLAHVGATDLHFDFILQQTI